MKKLSLLLALLFVGCASHPLYFPALGNVKNYSKCTPVYSTHRPASVAELKALMDAVKANPSILDKTISMGSILDTVGKNAPEIGSGVAAITTAVMGKLSTASIVGSTIMGGMNTLANARSEDRTQDRIDACVPDDSEIFAYRDASAQMIVVKRATPDAVAALTAINDAAETLPAPIERMTRDQKNG